MSTRELELAEGIQQFRNVVNDAGSLPSAIDSLSSPCMNALLFVARELAQGLRRDGRDHRVPRGQLRRQVPRRSVTVSDSITKRGARLMWGPATASTTSEPRKSAKPRALP
jgi:hypothetical protein